MIDGDASSGRRRRLDGAQARRVRRRVLAEAVGQVRPQGREGLLDRVGLLHGVGERDERVRVDRPAAERAQERRGLVGADDGEALVARGLDHARDEVVVADPVDDDGVEVGELLDVLRARLVVARVHLAGQDGPHLHVRSVSRHVAGPRVVGVQRHPHLERAAGPRGRRRRERRGHVAIAAALAVPPACSRSPGGRACRADEDGRATRPRKSHQSPRIAGMVRASPARKSGISTVAIA